MKVVILAGGLGTRLMEETESRPKPMVEIGGKPILWHIMKIYEAYGFNEFVVCLGYKSQMIKEYFLNYYLYNSDITVELEKNKVDVHFNNSESFKVTLIDTGLNTNTAGRIKRIREHLNDETFMLTYGDGVGNIDIAELVKCHEENKKLVTVTAVQPSGRFGALNLNESNQVNSFMEKPKGDGSWINGGYFVCEPEVFNYLHSDSEIWEREPMEQIAKEGHLQAYKHVGFWKPMDTLRDKQELEQAWESGNAPWKSWK